MTLDEQKLNLFETTLVGFRCITKFFLCGCSSKNFLKVNRKLFREFFLKKIDLEIDYYYIFNKNSTINTIEKDSFIKVKINPYEISRDYIK
jgi:hypothetical protein